MKVIQIIFWLILTTTVVTLVYSLSGCQVWSPSNPPSSSNHSTLPTPTNNFSWVANLGIIGIILGVVALTFGQSVGVKAIAIGASVLAVYFSVVKYSSLFAIGGVVLLLISVVGIIYVRVNAWKETIRSVNGLLDAYPQERKKMIEILKKYQSRTTRVLNSLLKAKIKVEEETSDSTTQPNSKTDSK